MTESAEPRPPGEQRTVLVPDGLAGERVDAAMARMFGLSRTKAADLIAQGLVHVDGAEVGKSDRVDAGAMLDVTIPAERDPLEVKPEIVEGIRNYLESVSGEAGGMVPA